MTRTFFPSWLILLCAASLSLPAQTTKRLYLVGNSVTDAINYNGLDQLAESRGNTHIWGRHMIPGAPLSYIWDHPDGGISEPPFGLYPNALPNYTWDAISLQTYDRAMDGADGDAVAAGNFINRAKGKSPNVQIYVYSRWPRKQSTYPETAAGWNQLWTRTYGSAGPNTDETKDYFEKLVMRLRQNHTDIKPVLFVPVGQVFHALNNKMAAGQVPGYSHIWQVYADGVHMTGIGSYIAACTYYATLYSQDPRGLSVPSTFGTISPEVAGIIQSTVWDVVRNEVLAGVNPDLVPPPLYKAAETPANTVAGVNYGYYEGTWSSLPAFNALTPVKTGNASGFSLAVRNRDDNFGVQYTGYVNVPADGTYTFYTASDDGSRLYIGTQLVVDNDGAHAEVERSGTIGLRAGKHAITVTYFEATGGEVLNVSYAGPGIAKTLIPAAALSSVPPAGANNPPTAVLNATPVAGTAPLVVSFNATGSSDPDAGDYILGYEWDFGDGSALSSSNAPSHTYTTPGTYTAKLRVMDNRNLYGAQVSRTITVSGSGGGGSGTGLRGEYYNNKTLTAPSVLVRTDAGVNLDNLPGAPAAGVSADNFSVRWTGQVEAPVSGSYTFSTVSDDGIRLWVNGVQVVNNWTDHAATTNTGTAMTLTGGQKYNLTLEFYDALYGATARLQWTYPGQATQLVPATRLYPAAGGGGGGTTTYLSDLTWTSASSGYGTTQKDKSIDANPIRLNGVSYAKGIGTHGASSIVYNLGGSYSTFLSDIGLDDEVDPYNCGSVAFEVYLDNVLAYASGTMSGTTATKSINLNVSGKTTLRLEVLLADGSNSCDHADWASARLLSGSTARLAAQPFMLERALSVYPNPSQGTSLQLRYRATESGTARITLAAASGGPVVDQPYAVQAGENTLQVPTGGLKAGLYLLSVQQQGRRLTTKVVLKR